MAIQRDQQGDTATTGRWSGGERILRGAAAVAPAVALLLWGDVGSAQADEGDTDFQVPEPSTLSLIAVGVGGAALVHRWRNRKK